MRTQDPNEYTGQEQYVQRCFDSKNIRFFPLKKAGRLLALSDETENDVSEIHSRIDGLEETVETVRVQVC